MSDSEAMLRQELSRDERLVWHGAPRGGLRLRATDAYMIPFSLLWGGFAMFWESNVVSAPRAPVFMMLWGIPFVLMGIYMIVGRFFVDAHVRARTRYGVTDSRAIIVTGVFSREVTSLSLAAMQEITLSERADRSGTIVFGPTPSGRAMVRGMYWPGAARSLPPAFDLIDEVRSVYRLIQRAQEDLRR